MNCVSERKMKQAIEIFKESIVSIQNEIDKKKLDKLT